MSVRLFSFFLFFTTLQETGFFEPSKDVLVLPLNAKRQFYCLTLDKAYSYTWKVNRTVVTSNSTFPDVVYVTSQTLSNGSTKGSLTFMAHAQVNNTDIECFVSNRSGNIHQLHYNIVIQGYLSAPDVTYVMKPHSVSFSWSAPFSLNITDYEPDILYYVINIIADNKTRFTMITTDTVYLLYPDLCLFSEYKVEIVAVNTVGMGEKYTSSLLSQEALNLSSANVVFSKDLTVINIQISTTCQKDIHYNVELIPTFSTRRIFVSNLSSVGQTSLTLSSSDIQLNEHYKAIVRVEGSTFSQLLNLSTFDVQTVEIKPQNDVKEFTDITCHFALGSLVRGCRIIISITGGEMNKATHYCEYTATRQEGSTEGTISVILPRGEYTVVVYDDEDAEVENPAYIITVTISSSSLIKFSGCELPIEEITPADGSVYVAADVTVFVILVVIMAIISI